MGNVMWLILLTNCCLLLSDGGSISGSRGKKCSYYEYQTSHSVVLGAGPVHRCRDQDTATKDIGPREKGEICVASQVVSISGAMCATILAHH